MHCEPMTPYGTATWKDKLVIPPMLVSALTMTPKYYYLGQHHDWKSLQYLFKGKGSFIMQSTRTICDQILPVIILRQR